eukprot:jgi/Mesvir1/12143/Mv00396-RA.1
MPAASVSLSTGGGPLLVGTAAVGPLAVRRSVSFGDTGMFASGQGSVSVGRGSTSIVGGGGGGRGIGGGIVAMGMRGGSRSLLPASSTEDSTRAREHWLSAAAMPPLPPGAAFPSGSAVQGLGALHGSTGEVGVGRIGGGNLPHGMGLCVIGSSTVGESVGGTPTPMPLRRLTGSRLSLLATSDENDFMTGMAPPLDTLVGGTPPLPPGNLPTPRTTWTSAQAMPQSSGEGAGAGGSVGGGRGIGVTMGSLASMRASEGGLASMRASEGGLASMRASEGMALGGMGDGVARWSSQGEDGGESGAGGMLVPPWARMQAQGGGAKGVSLLANVRTAMDPQAGLMMAGAGPPSGSVGGSLEEQDRGGLSGTRGNPLGPGAPFMWSANEMAILRALVGRSNSPLPVGGINFGSQVGGGPPSGGEQRETPSQVALSARLPGMPGDASQGGPVKPGMAASASYGLAGAPASMRSGLPLWNGVSLADGFAQQQGSEFPSPAHLGSDPAFPAAESCAYSDVAADRGMHKPVSVLPQHPALPPQPPLQRLPPMPAHLHHVNRIMDMERRSVGMPAQAEAGASLLSGQGMDCRSLGGGVRMSEDGFVCPQEAGTGPGQDLEGDSSHIFTDMLMFDKGMGCGADN